ncbi:MAG: hypothetical protein M1817_005322 [Caeruleum heppii]|nr:MAG: hypothetical protein M1817_005322 [Caeruleum heppii]
MSTMDVDAPISLASKHAPGVQTSATILCCNCGAPIDGTTSAGALCPDCIKLTIDISTGIPREATLHTCRDCDRWLQPPAHWLTAVPESRELLALCLRKLRGLNKVRIVDAGFIWTEPHSRRIRVKISIQQEAFEGTILQQTFEVEYVVAYHQCPDCAKSYTANTWRAVVQVRQKVPHKRTFLFLEQLILKHGAHRDTINIREVKDGLDFFFAARNHAEKFLDFLHSVAPVRAKKSQELISMDIHTSSKSYKFSFSVELIPICKDDLVALPLKLAKSSGNISPLTLCHRVGTSLNVLDPHTLQTAEIPTAIYWRAPFTSLADVQSLVEYVIMDIELLGPSKGRLFLAEATVAKSSDLGVNDTTYFTRTHLGGLLHAGDTALGYSLHDTNFNNAHFEALESNPSLAAHLPDVVLVKKSYARRSKKKNPNSASARNWRLKRMTVRDEDAAAAAAAEGGMEMVNKPGKKLDRGEAERRERDYEMFLREVEEDAELRGLMSLYKNQGGGRKGEKAEKMEGVETAGAPHAEMVGGEDGGDDDHDDDDDELPQIQMEELLDEFDELRVGGGNHGDGLDEDDSEDGAEGVGT